MKKSVHILAFALFSLCLFHIPTTQAATRPEPDIVRVELVTGMGSITVAVDRKRAPKTADNFLTYVDDGRFDGTDFYRAARSKARPGTGYVQGGIRTNLRRSLPPIAHERTDVTGITHLDATISMARGNSVDTAKGNFFITVGPTPHMDARGDYAGYAAFGRVVSGMDVVKRILAQPSGGGVGPMKGQMILKPVILIRAKRLNGTPHPSKYPKAWLLWEKK
ncbi:MAG: peptidylprolyl isomerase [Sphingobium sp.]|nr:peptidylprolyl isomerase [Sphingobium sp.]